MRVLMLRGPQTVGELRGRTERLYTFDDLEAVGVALDRLAEWAPNALVKRLPRQPGLYKEARFARTCWRATWRWRKRRRRRSARPGCRIAWPRSRRRWRI